MNATNDDIRRLLRTFGVQADEVMQAHVRSARAVDMLRFRIVLEDITDYGGGGTEQPPRLVEVEGEVSR